MIDFSVKTVATDTATPPAFLSSAEEKAEKKNWGNVFTAYATKALRITGFLLIGLMLRWVILAALWVLKPFNLFQYLFLVYPGSESDLRGYCPPWLARTWVFSKKPTVAGIITKGKSGRGLYLVVPNTAVEFLRKKDVCDEVVKRLKSIMHLTGAKSIAIAGQVPGMIARNGVKIEQPVVRGNKGTVFCVMETVGKVCEKHKLQPGVFKIALVGVGYVGELLLDELKSIGHDVTGIDIAIRREGVLIGEDGQRFLGQADMVIVLTPKGKDFAPYVKHLRAGAIVIDDTHPRIKEKPANTTFYKVAVGMPDVIFFPRLPGYAKDWIPGCTVEGIYSAATGDFNGTPQAKFNEICRQLGFFAHLVS